MSPTFSLIHTFTADEIRLSGLYQAGDTAKEAVIFTHGFTGDFYTHVFYENIAAELHKNGNAIIFAQNRGTGLRTEFFKKDGSAVYLGSFYEKIEHAHLDISSFVSFLHNEGYTKIVLAGHSLGTIKSVRYLFEGEYRAKISKLILLAPFDKNAFMQRKAPNQWQEYLVQAELMISEGKGQDLVPVPEYEDFPLTYETFVSWYNQSELSCMWDFYRSDYDFPTLQKIAVPVKVILGENDPFVDYAEFGVSAESALATMKKFIKKATTVLIPNADHAYSGAEDQVGKEVASFLS